MDTAANLAFFQNFYTNAALYVLPEAAPAAATPAAEPVKAALKEQTTVPNPQPVAPAPMPVIPPAAPARVPAATGAATTGAATTGAATTGAATAAAPVVAPSVSLPTPAPVAAPVAAVPSAPAQAPVPPVQLVGTLPLANLPAAAQAPAGRVQPTPTESPVAHIPFSTLGSNPHGLVLLVRVAPEQFRKLPRNVFLNNLLKALRLVMEDVVLVNVEHDKFPVALCSLRRELAARQILAFGKNLLDVAVYTTQPYEPVLLYGDTAFLGAGEIDMLEYDAGRKKQLWQAVQRMFMG